MWRARETETRLPGGAHPHTGTAAPRCTTIPLPKMRGSRSDAVPLDAVSWAAASVAFDAADAEITAEIAIGCSDAATRRRIL